MRPWYCHGSIIALCFMVKCILNESLGVWGGRLCGRGYSWKIVRLSQSNGRGRYWWKHGWGVTITGAMSALKKIVNQRHGGCVKSEMRIGLFTSLIPIRLQGTFIKQEHAMLCLRLPDPCTFVSLIWLNNRSPTETLSVVAEREELLGTLKLH